MSGADFHDVLSVGGDRDKVDQIMLDSPSSSSSSSFESMPTPKKSVKKLSLHTEESNDHEEMVEEIERSKTSLDCNLAALKLQAVPAGLPLDILTKLSLSENNLISIPEEVFAGTSGQNLVDIDINSSHLTSVPTSLFRLSKLKVLMLNHNDIEVLPVAEDGGARPLLPSIERIGLEFNNLRQFPIEFFEHCGHLSELLLGQNESMFDAPVSLERLRNGVVAKTRAADGSCGAVSVRVDNRPRLIAQTEEENWSRELPWLAINFHKIYPDKVFNFLFLGSMRTAQTTKVYHDFNIAYVLTVGRDLDVKLDPGMHHLVIPVDDLPGEDMTPLFEEAFAFIEAARRDNKGILLHCFAGLSRSVTIAAAYLMKTMRISRDAALKIIRQARPAAQPNSGFMDCLLRYEKTLNLGDRHSGLSEAPVNSGAATAGDSEESTKTDERLGE